MRFDKSRSGETKGNGVQEEDPMSESNECVIFKKSYIIIYTGREDTSIIIYCRYNKEYKYIYI